MMTGEIRQVVGQFVEILTQGVVVVLALCALVVLLEKKGIPVLARSRPRGWRTYTNPIVVAIAIALWSAVVALRMAFASGMHLPQVAPAAVLVGVGTFVLVGLQCLVGWVALRKSPNAGYGVFLGLIVGVSTVTELAAAVREAYGLM